MCKPYLHAKFIIVDCRIVLWGSVNPTNAGMYDNDEILYISKKPMHLTRHKEIFDELWYDPRNTTWEKVQQYFGHKGHVTHKKMAEAILGFFDMNGNQEVFEKGLVERIARRLDVNTRDVSETIENLVIDSALYRPKPHTLKRT
jgi:phosphatidylserine/phosphatidylglycerophosphate/cardiolipin synthase-like enzyme